MRDARCEMQDVDADVNLNMDTITDQVYVSGMISPCSICAERRKSTVLKN